MQGVMEQHVHAAASPPTSPIQSTSVRPSTATMAPPPLPPKSHSRTQSRMAMADTGSRASDEDGARTAVKVAVRVRPPLKPSDPGFDLIPQRFRESTCEVSNPTSLSVQSPQGKKLFVFDRVFDEQTNQEGVWEYVSDSVSSFVKGYNVSILAYGQSGAGKSYTMGTSGPEDQADTNVRGIVPRAAHALFEKLNGPTARPSALQTPKRYSTQGLPTLASLAKASAASKNWELKATYVEIYNEQLRDLLVSETTPLHERAQVAIREDTKGRILLTGLTQVPIHSVEDILNALNFGSTIRQTDATAINARSSRSHAVFSLNLVQKKSDNAPSASAAGTPKLEKRMSVPIENVTGAENIVTLDSKLHFVDLAGSERLKNTGATGDRAKEGISINAGLASLGKVISQLSSKHSGGHISYRDSRLTRLLQDSLGGNAITFMVACVTPAVFHLSETLNTVHYAQRARAIQSRPEIQQSHEEGDKQAVIDRLRSEVRFLRDQIRHTERGGPNGLDESAVDRYRGKESNALQSQLLDMQENYNALSQRHAKLIAEISKSRDSEDGDTPLLNEAIGDNASERIKRSNSFAEAVEQVVLEYEKTIQSLETSLSMTRSSLASTESALLEKETRIAYMDTIQQQLQTRVSKYMEREATYDSYTRDLEGKMEGATSLEERKDTLIGELRKEIARVRDSEAGAEDYISTLEERLAEAEQDQEIMQREIDRLEHVVERQRSIGRLDNLLGDLDASRGSVEPQTNGFKQHSRSATPEVNGANHDPFGPSTPNDHSSGDEFERVEREEADIAHDSKVVSAQDAPRSPAQNEFMAEKLENLTQEFFDLRSEHETVLTDYDHLQQKYRTALETLAKLEYEKEAVKPPADAQSDRSSFLEDAGMKEGEKMGRKASEQQPSSSQSSGDSLLQEQSNAGAEAENERSLDSEHVAVVGTHTRQASQPQDHEDLVQEMETLKKVHAEKEDAVAELTKNYMNLAQRHESTLSQVEELKREVQNSQSTRPASPSVISPSGFSKHGWRRKSEEILSGTSDRAARSFVSLKSMVLNNFEDQAETRQSFEQHLTTVMAELHSRSERVTSLEAEIATVKKEMESKQQIIAGLTRERSSLAAVSASGVDFSVVGQMREQLMESENQIRTLHEQHEVREKELSQQIQQLKETLAEHQKTTSVQNDQLPTPSEDYSQVPGTFPRSPALELDQAASGLNISAGAADHSMKRDEVLKLQEEVAAWESKHQEAMDTMTSSQAQLLHTIADLQESLLSADARSAAATEEVVDTLTSQVLEHKKVADDRVTKLEGLHQAYSKAIGNIGNESHSNNGSEKEMIANLERQLQDHQSAMAEHQESLEALQASHSREVEKMADKHLELLEQHQEVTADLQQQLVSVQAEKTDLLRSASSALGHETDASRLQSQIQGLVEEGKELHERHLKSTNQLKDVQEELQSAVNRSVDMEQQIGNLKQLVEEREAKLAKMTDKYDKASGLVEELEQQLNSTFDSHQETNKRLSTMQSETVTARMELERELEDQKMKALQLEQQLNAFKHMSTASSSTANRDSLSPDAAAIALGRSSSAGSNQRKSGPTGLPTPPPSIPLPPLPGSPNQGGPAMNGFDRTTSPTPRGASPVPTGISPPGSRHTSNDVSSSPAVSQIIEEQEARIRTIEKHLFAEKQLTATLEEALVDLETSANRTKSEMENWRKKCQSLEDELVGLRKERTNSRASLQAVEEEREMRVRAERARQALEQRMAELNANKKKKKNGLNCF